MKIYIKDFLVDIATIFIISLIVIYGWRGLELLMIGKINPNNVDSIVGTVLMTSLYTNVQMYKKFKK